MAVGGCGVISVASHFIGNDIVRMQEAFLKGDLDAARSIHYAIMPLCKGIFAAPNPTCVKYALAKLGLSQEHLRLPLVPLSTEQKHTMDDLLAGYNLAKQLQVNI
jgi:4-hydroxy-tetrahydrodipicolinate synthase